MGSSLVFSGVRATPSLVLCVCFLDRCLSLCAFFFWPLCCLFFFYLRILITPLVSSNLSCSFNIRLKPIQRHHARGESRVTLNDLTPPHFCSCSKLGHGFSTSYVVVCFVFSELRWGVIVGFCCYYIETERQVWRYQRGNQNP